MTRRIAHPIAVLVLATWLGLLAAGPLSAEVALPAGAVVRIDPGHGRLIASLAFAPDGKSLATAGIDTTIRLYDPRTGKEQVQLKGHTNNVYCVAFSPDGKSLASASLDHTVRLWDRATGKPLHVLKEHQDGVTCVAFAPDGKTIASASYDGTVRLWDVATGKHLRKEEAERRKLLSVVFAPGGKILAAGGEHRTLLFWDLATGKCVDDGDLPIFSAPDTMAFTPDGEAVVCAINGGWGVTNRPERREGKPFREGGQVKNLLALALSPDGGVLATAAADQPVRLWQFSNGQPADVLRGHDDVSAVAFSPDGTYLATGGGDGLTLIWDLSALAARDSKSPGDFVSSWSDLGRDDVMSAYRGMAHLAGMKEKAVPLLRERLGTPPDAKHVARLIANLDANTFPVREAAARELESHGRIVEGALRRALEAKPPLEVKTRLERLLELLEASKEMRPSGRELRPLRAIQVLERIGTPEARAVLERLATGPAEAQTTQRARAALARLGS